MRGLTELKGENNILKRENDELKARVFELKNENATLKSEIDRLHHSIAYDVDP